MEALNMGEVARKVFELYGAIKIRLTNTEYAVA
jgi:hypothetical protein